MMAVDPGNVFNYIYHVPSNHMGGTLWYHPHHHHSTAGQADGGMLGALLVEDQPLVLPFSYGFFLFSVRTLSGLRILIES